MHESDPRRRAGEEPTGPDGVMPTGSAPVVVSGGKSPGRETPLDPALAGGGGQRGARFADKDLTTGSIPRNLFHLAWPQVSEGALNALDQLLDLFWAGRGVGFRGIASIGVAQNYIQFLRLGRQGIDISTRAMVARSVGSNDLQFANHVVLQGFTLNLILALLTIVPGVIFTEFLLHLLGASDALVSVGTTYMQVQFLASAAGGFRMSAGAALQAAGDTLTPMKASMVARVVDWILTPIVMFGWLGLPEYGLVGVAIVNTLSNVIGTGMNTYGLFTGSSKLRLDIRAFTVDFPLMWRMVRLGAPSSVTNAERSLSQLFIVGIVASFGDIALAAFALTRRVETIVNLGSQGLGNAAGVIAGQNIGAGRSDRGRQTLWWAVGYVSILRVGLGAILFTFPTFFISIFSEEPELLEVGTVWLQILVVGFVLQGPVQIFQQAFQIAGDTMMPMVTVIATVWLVELPLAVSLSGVVEGWPIFGWTPPIPKIMDLGQYGAAWALSLGMVSRLLVYFPYFLWGPWATKEIFGDRAPGRMRMGGGGGGGGD